MEKHLERARGLMATSPLIDGHNDFPFIIRGFSQNKVSQTDFQLEHLPIGQTDFAGLKKGLVGGQFWSAFMPCPKPENDDGRGERVVIDTIQQIDLIHALIEKYPHILGLALTADDV
ncbi:membrane dipeptidase GliJ [Penicillium angulare]|uniref:Dipeptidase n=1 Tax=Penicillium angulare TaxID=116970 RepID=A0A9W9FW67_9EURO|nr:membrane dipeptidase GliJ [Penicillium angulare]